MSGPANNTPPPARRLCQQSEMLAQVGHYAEAVRAALDALALEPESAEALCLLAQAQSGLGRPDEALASASRACAAAPDNEWGHRLRAIYLRRRGELAAALLAAREAVRLGPDLDLALAALVDVLTDIGETDEALRVARRIREVAPQSVRACERCGGIALAREEYGEAEAHFRAGLALDPLHNVCLANLGWALDGQGRHREAIDCFAAMLTQHPDDPYIDRVRRQLYLSVMAYMRDHNRAVRAASKEEMKPLWEARQTHWNALPAAVRHWYAHQDGIPAAD